MVQTASTDAGISQRVQEYAAREMLKWAGPVVILDKLGMTKPMPKNKGVNIKFRRPNVFTKADTPLSEGVTPSATAFSYTDVSAALKQYGQVVQITDVIQDTHEDPVLNDATVQCGENIGRTIESLTFGIVKAGTTVSYTNGSARSSVNTTIVLDDQRSVTRTLLANKAMMMTRILDGSPNYKTTPVEAGYIAASHTDMEADIRNMTGFTPTAEYGSRRTIHEYELGTVERVRYLCSPDLGPFKDGGGAKAGSGTTMVSSAGTSADVYPIMYFGKEAFGCVPLRGVGAVEPTIIPVNQKDKSDPLGQRGYVGWKTWFVCVVLNEAWMARLESAATAL